MSVYYPCCGSTFADISTKRILICLILRAFTWQVQPVKIGLSDKRVQLAGLNEREQLLLKTVALCSDVCN